MKAEAAKAGNEESFQVQIGESASISSSLATDEEASQCHLDQPNANEPSFPKKAGYAPSEDPLRVDVESSSIDADKTMIQEAIDKKDEDSILRYR